MSNATFRFGAIKSDDITISQTFLDAILFHLKFCFLILVTEKKQQKKNVCDTFLVFPAND